MIVQIHNLSYVRATVYAAMASDLEQESSAAFIDRHSRNVQDKAGTRECVRVCIFAGDDHCVRSQSEGKGAGQRIAVEGARVSVSRS